MSPQADDRQNLAAMSDDQFRLAVRAWLQDTLERFGHRGLGYPEMRDVDYGIRWELHLSDSGWTGLTWPRRYGGHELPFVRQVIFDEEYAVAEGPVRLNAFAHGILAPALLHYGSPQQKDRFLPGILSNRTRWCQGYSEPGAGSDLANIATRARRVTDSGGERYLVSGQKVWTSLADLADWGFMVVRTEAGSRRQSGLSCLLVDMKTPGITIRPLRQMTGAARYCEVFFDEVEVPAGQRVGEEGQGWEIAMTAANHERGTFFMAHVARMQNELAQLVELLQTRQLDGRPAAEDPVVQDRLARSYLDASALRLCAYRTMQELSQGRPPGPQSSLIKLCWSEAHQRLCDLAVDVLGTDAQYDWTDPSSPGKGQWQFEHLWSRAETILAGTSEIQRNIIAERGLGLPR